MEINCIIFNRTKVPCMSEPTPSISLTYFNPVYKLCEVFPLFFLLKNLRCAIICEFPVDLFEERTQKVYYVLNSFTDH